MPEHTDYHTPEYVLEYAARQVGVEPEVLRRDTRDPTPDPIRREGHRPVYECGRCGADVTGNHRVRDGEAFCTDCEPLAVGRGKPDPDFEPPQSIEEYMERRGVVLPVSALMDGGDPR